MFFSNTLIYVVVQIKLKEKTRFLAVHLCYEFKTIIQLKREDK